MAKLEIVEILSNLFNQRRTRFVNLKCTIFLNSPKYFKWIPLFMFEKFRLVYRKIVALFLIEKLLFIVCTTIMCSLYKPWH
jgi:hypothetical protein